MRQPAAPPWLLDLQRRFTAALRVPLRNQSGTLRPDEDAYDPELLEDIAHSRFHGAPNASVAVYNRQYWLRLLAALQQAYPLTSRLLGLFEFNLLGQRYLLSAPPGPEDLGLLGEGLAAHLAEQAPAIPQGVLEAARIDESWRRAFLAPYDEPWQPSRSMGAALASVKLRRRRAVELVEERWPLLALRRSLPDGGETRIDLPPRHPAPIRVALVRVHGGMVEQVLPPVAADLLELIPAMTVGEALAELERRHADLERATLAEEVQWFFRRAAELALFSPVLGE